MDAPLPLIVTALLAAGAVLLPGARARAWSTLGALVLAPVLLVADIWDTEQIRPLRDHPALALVAVLVGLAALGALAVLFDRRPWAFPLAAAFAIPFRVPIASGGSTSNLLVPLYVVVGAGALAYVVPRIWGEKGDERERKATMLEWLLALTVVVYAIQASYSDDFDKALENVVFFYVPFALLFALLARIEWSRELAVRVLAVLVGLAIVFACIGFVEYETRHLLLNPKVIASNQFEDYFRVNSLFFDPNIYGRFLAIVMLGVATVLIWSRTPRNVYGSAAVLVVLWAGLVLTLSQSSFAALLLGLLVLAGARWSPRWALGVGAAALVIGALFVVVAPSSVRLDLNSSKSADTATSGRYDLVKGGLDLFADKPLAGYGSGGFSRAYRRQEKGSAEKAVSASHTIPVTVAAEQGIIGLSLYLMLLVVAFTALFRGVREDPVRAGLAAAFAALVLHTWSYASFLEDPLTWALLGAGLAFSLIPRHRKRPDVAAVAS
ncbi:MAG TPA: O-antigen ligase family protein [Baekduia sp.]|uniref:O-antigen ligase family protein n=1 Tax=Baekduia sp. TaxID=2600305 RepID=UPI002D775DF6|nr:O-antigen ligase family protein [Baekduia sp.]HET6508917.1 O-antigen ligase family protein [Baekduia sp.]